MVGKILSEQLGRRRFLRRAGIVGVSVPFAGSIIGAACADDPAPARGPLAAGIPGTAPAATATSTASHGGTVTAAQGGHTDEMTEAGVKLFLKNTTEPITKGKGGTRLPFTLDNGVKVFDITCDTIQWEVAPGQVEDARCYNKMVPGPVIRATEGDRVRIRVKNNLPESTGVHWHGLVVPNNMDGVPYVTQPPIRSGETFTYEFTLRNSGTHMYHSHHNAFDQMNRGMLGAFIVDPKDPGNVPEVRSRAHPRAERHLARLHHQRQGVSRYRCARCEGWRAGARALDERRRNAPPDAPARDAHARVPERWIPHRTAVPVRHARRCPGNRYDTIIEATEPGVWAFHCHILSHAELDQGMFGLVTALVVR